MIKVKADTHCNNITNKIKDMVVDLHKKNILNEKDKTMITGLNNKNKMKHAPEYRPEAPYIYPLYKIHKLTQEDIENKVVPPSRMVNAAKYGPLYRMEKWISPYLTSSSQIYCENEYIQDTPHLTQLIKDLNETGLLANEEVNLFTMDVEKLYPSIKPSLAMEALRDMLHKDISLNENIKKIIEKFVNVILEESFVTYDGNSFKAKIGIPTGGCNSRQIADTFLQWLLFQKIKPIINGWELILFWKRFIDDGIGIWKGTRDEFDEFIKSLNEQSKRFGINFPLKEVQFGRSVNFLDLTIYLDEENTIHHKLYVKPTDSRCYLNPGSFHPSHVFSSIPFSQMIRIINRNTKPESCQEDLNGLKIHLKKSGYNENTLETMQFKAFERIENPRTRPPHDNHSIVFSVDYFEDFKAFKQLIKNIEVDINAVFGEMKIVVTARKCSSIGNMVVKNKSLCMPIKKCVKSQKCGDKRCKICPLMLTTESVLINDKKLSIPKHLNCKSKEVVYLCICKKCTHNNAYFGQTVQEEHNRMTGHREKFNIAKYHKSALSMHAYDVHNGELTLEDFNIAVMKKATPRRLNREEYMLIDKFDTLTRGLNRYQVV